MNKALKDNIIILNQEVGLLGTEYLYLAEVTEFEVSLQGYFCKSFVRILKKNGYAFSKKYGAGEFYDFTKGNIKVTLT